MKKLIIIILAASSIILYSCEKSTDRNDRESPTVSDVLAYISQEEKDILKVGLVTTEINISPDRDIDTLVIGGNIYLSLRASDNDQLSNLRVSIVPIATSTPEEDLTSKAFTAMPKVYSGIFGKKDTTFTKVYFGNIPPSYKASNGKDILEVREGDYHLRFSAVDYSGNQSDTLAYRVVRILSPETITGKKQ